MQDANLNLTNDPRDASEKAERDDQTFHEAIHQSQYSADSELPIAAAVADPNESAAVNLPLPEKSNWVERLLSPQSLQRMMACGGGLLVLGFVVWLWSIGIFENPMSMAAGIGTGTLAMLSLGIGLVKRTQYQLAGRGITLLAALALPLNLWFYDSQGLMTLANGGHLWIPAALCCGIYAAVAKVLRDSTFVYTFVGGVVMTGMLLLADQNVNHFWMLLPPTTFLIVTGWICIFSERFFSPSDGEFSQQKFGKAFWRSGAVVLSSGLMLLLGGQLSTLINTWLWQVQMPGIVVDPMQKAWAIGLLTGSCLGFIAQAAIQHSRSTVVAAILLSVWTLFSVLDFFSLRPDVIHLTIVLSLAIIVINGFTAYRLRNAATVVDGSSLEENDRRGWNFANTVRALSLFGIVILTTAAIGQFLAQFVFPLGSWFSTTTRWISAVQMIGAALAIQSTATCHHLNCNHRNTSAFNPMVNSSLMALSGIVLTMGLWTVGLLLDKTFATFAILGTVIPISMAIAALTGRDRHLRQSFQALGSLGMLTSLGCLFAFTAMEILPTADGHLAGLVISTFVAAMFFALSIGSDVRYNTYIGYLAATIAMWQMFLVTDLEFSVSLILAPTVVGILMCLVDGFRMATLPKDNPTVAQKRLGHLLVLVASVCGILVTLNRILGSEPSPSLLAALGIQLVATGTLGYFERQDDWRLMFRAITVGTLIALATVAYNLSQLNGVQRIELLSLFLGSVLLGLSHIAWSRETEKQDDMASLGLALGSLLVVTPLAIGLVGYRLEGSEAQFSWRLFHEIGTLVAALLLLGTGMICKIRWTTICGSVLLGIYILSLAILVRWPQQLQSASVVMMIGGGVFFSVSALLSIYRDKITSLPKKVRTGQSLFSVLKWR